MKRVDPKMTARARALRREATPEERLMWAKLSRFRPPFTRQLSISDSYVADLACRQARLAIELDGRQHDDSTYDAARTQHLHELGWHVIRFWNNEVRENADGVAEAILERATELLGFEPIPIPSRAGRERKPTLR
jgi:very-short-patch-repair endonuclease